MITLAKFSESFIEKGKRILKFLEFGAKSGNESAPFGYDGNPLKDTMAIHAKTSNNSENVIIGYINDNQKADIGEVRIYSLDSSKSLKSFLWLKKDGTIELNGSTYSLVKFEPLETAIKKHDTDINTELAKISAAIAPLGAVYVPAPINTDISNSKAKNIKTE